MTENEISYIIRGVIFKVYNKLGPGLLESVYHSSLVTELKFLNLKVEEDRPFYVKNHNDILIVGYRADIVVNNIVIVEVKSVDRLHQVHHKQLMTYLRISGLKLGLLVNFNTDRIQDSIIRKVNNL